MKGNSPSAIPVRVTVGLLMAVDLCLVIFTHWIWLNLCDKVMKVG